MQYRAEIDGLRALAVVPVILFHAGFHRFSGGFVGVDVFFVISGYLITSILLQDIRNDRFSIQSFYERRARRILPALYVVMLVCIPFAWLLMLPEEMKDFAESLFATTLFLSNVHFFGQIGYFAPVAEEQPLLHTWSLAVEEQYYLVFPLLLALLWRFGSKRALLSIAGLALMSFLLCEWGWRKDAAANFYLPLTRVWELFVGSITAFIVMKHGVQRSNLLSFIGLLAIVGSMFLYNESTPFPSVYALAPVIGTALLVLYAGNGTLVAKLLSTKALVGIGLISYSAYLWHQPLFAYGRLAGLDDPNGIFFIIATVLTLILAWLSWAVIERPFRNRRLVSGRAVLYCSIGFGLFFIVAGLVGHFMNSQIESLWLSRQPASVQNMYAMIEQEDPVSGNFGADENGQQHFTACRFNVREVDSGLEQRLRSCFDNYGVGVMVLGDSHAVDLFGVITSRFENAFIVGITKEDCRPHANHSHCSYDNVKDLLTANPERFSMVIFEQAGFYLLKDNNGSPGSRSMFSDIRMTGAVRGITIDEPPVNRTADYLRELATSVKVKWLLPRAEPHIGIRNILRHGCEYDYAFRENQYEIFEQLDTYIEDLLVNDSNIVTVSQNDIFQFSFPGDFMSCDGLYWSDGDHFSAMGEQRFGLRLPADFLTQ